MMRGFGRPPKRLFGYFVSGQDFDLGRCISPAIWLFISVISVARASHVVWDVMESEV